MPKAKNERIDVMAARTRAIVEACGSIAEAARIGGVSVNTVSRMCSGSHEPGVVAATLFAKAHGVTVEYLLGLPGPAPVDFDPATHSVSDFADTIVEIPILDVKVAAGSGRVQDVIEAVDNLPFARSLLLRLAPADAKLSSLRCSGTSMEPTIKDGALLIIDERQNALPPPRPSYRKSPRVRQKPDDIYVFFQSEDLRMKRLRALDEGFLAIYSDNDVEHPIEITKPGRDGALVIVGKVIWWDNRL